MGIRYIHWNQSCNAYQWKNHEKGFSTDCFFIYNSDHHILIHGLFNHENANLMFQLGPLKFYREGMMYALRISCNVLNMLLAFAVFVLTTKPAELVEDLEQAGFSPKIGYVISSVFRSYRR